MSQFPQAPVPQTPPAAMAPTHGIPTALQYHVDSDQGWRAILKLLAIVGIIVGMGRILSSAGLVIIMTFYRFASAQLLVSTLPNLVDLASGLMLVWGAIQVLRRDKSGLTIMVVAEWIALATSIGAMVMTLAGTAMIYIGNSGAPTYRGVIPSQFISLFRPLAAAGYSFVLIGAAHYYRRHTAAML